MYWDNSPFSLQLEVCLSSDSLKDNHREIYFKSFGIHLYTLPNVIGIYILLLI